MHTNDRVIDIDGAGFGPEVLIFSEGRKGGEEVVDGGQVRFLLFLPASQYVMGLGGWWLGPRRGLGVEQLVDPVLLLPLYGADVVFTFKLEGLADDGVPSSFNRLEVFL